MKLLISFLFLATLVACSDKDSAPSDNPAKPKEETRKDDTKKEEQEEVMADATPIPLSSASEVSVPSSPIIPEVKPEVEVSSAKPVAPTNPSSNSPVNESTETTVTHKDVEKLLSSAFIVTNSVKVIDQKIASANKILNSAIAGQLTSEQHDLVAALVEQYQQQKNLTERLLQQSVSRKEEAQTLYLSQQSQLQQKADAKDLEISYCAKKYSNQMPTAFSICYYKLGLGSAQELALFFDLASVYEQIIHLQGNAKLATLEKNYCQAKYADKLPTKTSKCYFVFGLGTQAEFNEFWKQASVLRQHRTANGMNSLRILAEQYDL